MKMSAGESLAVERDPIARRIGYKIVLQATQNFEFQLARDSDFSSNFCLVPKTCLSGPAGSACQGDGSDISDVFVERV
jgi:hypothetical protein